jgi:hypothetical protein
MLGRISPSVLSYERKTKPPDNDADIVPDMEKEILWANVKRHFSVPEEHEQLFKDWVMKKMAIAFQMFKKNLNKDFFKKGLTPDFENDFKNQRPCWDAFGQYKSSEDSEQHKPERMRARKKTSIILAKEVTRRLFRSGRRWKKTLLQEESCRQPSTSRCEQKFSFMLTEAH